MPAPRLSPTEADELVRLYAADISTNDLAKQFGVSRCCVLGTLRRQGVEIRPRGGGPHRTKRFSPEDTKAICAAYLGGEGYYRIAERFGTSHDIVKRTLDEAGIDSRMWLSRPRERHTNWRGGRRITSDGYVSVLWQDGDPVGDKVGPYILEHRLVMARALGRPLKRHETIHHINGDRQDNRLENLQLRNGKHGSGQVLRCRACGSHDIERVRLSQEAR